jgi:hypothetical protein
MRKVIVMLVLALVTSVGHAAGASWYPKASDSCSKFKADFNATYDKLLQHPELIKRLWRDNKVVNLKKAIDALFDDNSSYSHAIYSLDSLITISMYCDNHRTTLLGDISAVEVVNEWNKVSVAPQPIAPQPTTPPAPKVLTLNCTMEASEIGGISLPAFDQPLTIDFTNNTVNGNKAEFYENEIRWTYQTTSGSNFNAKLNRLSGSYSYGNDQFPILRTGHCAPATRQF